MPTVRPATTADLPGMVELLSLDARRRHAADPILWALADDVPARIEEAVSFALTAGEQPFRQHWLAAADGPTVLGVIHAMHLPVPPIYAGRLGRPGLILPDSLAADEAPPGTVAALIEAAEAALAEAGAEMTLASIVAGEPWGATFAARGYEPLTLYLSRTGLRAGPTPAGIRPATEADLPRIVARSAEHRAILFGLDPFWEPHPEADPRFHAWMRRSLTLPDRDMLAAEEGYAIAQPASRLHFPPAHDIARVGVIDDFHHAELADPEGGGGPGAPALLRAAEGALADRGIGAAFVVCPAAWRSKVALLEGAGYGTAMVWSIRR